jgi:hypothetical protein
MADAVRDIILQPMQEMFLPPVHLRRHADAQARALDAYAKALAQFDSDTLQRAWQQVVARQTYWIWPSCGAIVEACRQCRPRPAPPTEEQQRKAKALDMADAYAGRFMKTSHLAQLAVREGWSGRLREYVTDAASVQAQLICGVRDVSFSSNLLDGPNRFHSAREAFAAYRQTVDEQIERGEIDVQVPPARIQQWQEQGRHGRNTIPTASG